MIDFIQSIDWPFILKILVLLIFWNLGSYFYKYSSWLHTNRFSKIDSSEYPRIINYIRKYIEKEGFVFYAFAIIIGLPCFGGGIILLLIVGKGTLEEFEATLSNKFWWEQVLMCMCLILFYFGVRVWWDGKKKK